MSDTNNINSREGQIKETAERIYASLVGACRILCCLPETFGSIPDDEELKTEAYQSAIVWHDEDKRLPSWLQERIHEITGE